ncbi:hypothetical protein NMG60_11015788 [Bertholletia excelsa]
MEKLAIILLLCSTLVVSTLVHGVEQGPEAVERWFKKLRHKREKVTKLHFYFHDNVTGKNITTVQVARYNTTSNTSISFGSVFVLDDPLTVGPEPNSTLLGRAQGIFASSSMEEVSFLMPLNFVFTSGNYKGSTLSLLGRNPIFNEYREMPIVGGSGVFRLARGIATVKTYWFDVASLNAVVEYNVIVIHY